MNAINEKEIFKNIGAAMAQLIAHSVQQLQIEKQNSLEEDAIFDFSDSDIFEGDFWNNSKVMHISKLINIFKIVNDLNNGDIATIEDQIYDASEDAAIIERFLERSVKERMGEDFVLPKAE